MTNARQGLSNGQMRGALVVIFALSGVGLAYEVALTRLFSLIFQYHYVFLIVSLAVAGLGIGAALATLAVRGENRGPGWADLANVAALLTLLLLGNAALLALLRSAMLLVVFAAALLPFIAIGFLNAALFSRFARRSGILYAADLIGGVVGLAAILVLLGWIGAFDGVILLAALCAFVAVLLARMGQDRALQKRLVALAVIPLAILILSRLTGLIAFQPANIADAPPDKTLMQTLQDPEATLLETRWDPFARLDVVATGDEAVRYVFTDAGAGSTMVRYSGDDRAVRWLQREVAYLPFTPGAGQTDSVLILGAGAGKDVLMAYLAGAQTITAVEINPTLIDLTRDAADYNGGVLDLPGVETFVMDGRNYIERTDRLYDLIYANIVYSQAAPPASSALAENYIFTQEALHAYWSHLTEDGRIAFVTHHGIEGVRLLLAALTMLRDEGMTLQEALGHVALATLRGGDPQTRTSVVLITRQPWTIDSANAFAGTAHAINVGLLYLPGFQELALSGLLSGFTTLNEYIAANSDYNYTPTTDDSPFFYQFTPGLPGGLSDLLLLSAMLIFAYFSWLSFFFVRQDGSQWTRIGLAPYFGLLGAAFMLIEIPLIQRFGLLLGQPILALVVVVGALLLGGGLGSLFSSLVPTERMPRLAGAFAMLVGATALLSLALYPALIRWALPFELPARVAVTIAALLPAGFLMGVCFPGGLRVAHQVDPRAIPAFYGSNAVTSVLGSALAMALAISIGFSAALVLGAVFYGLAAALAFLTWPRMLAR